MHPRSRAGSLVAGIALLATGVAHAEPAPRLEYVVYPGAVGCPSEREFRDAVAARLGRDPFATESTRALRVEVRVEGGELSTTGALVEPDGSAAGLRRLTGAPGTCGEVVLGMALAVSLAMNPALDEPSGATSEPPPPAAEPEPPAPAAPPPAAAPTKPPPRAQPPADRGTASRSTQPASPSELELGLGFAAHLAAGVGPGVGLGGAVLAAGRMKPWSLAVEGRFDGLSTGMSAGSGSVQSTLVAGVLAPCRHLGVALVCGLGLAGSFRAESNDVESPRAGAAPYAAAGARLGAEWPLAEHVLLQVRLDLLATLLPVHIELDDREIWSSPLASGALGAGLVGFP